MVLYRMAKNEGKIFEESFVSSVDKSHILVKRLNDNAASWSGGNASRFASKNECDFILYEMNERIFMGLELKSTKNSLTFWREDFEIKGVKQSFNIKKNQILGLSKWSEYNGTICGLVVNFREFNNKTFFIEIKDFLKYTDKLNKKSISDNCISACVLFFFSSLTSSFCFSFRLVTSSKDFSSKRLSIKEKGM